MKFVAKYNFLICTYFVVRHLPDLDVPVPSILNDKTSGDPFLPLCIFISFLGFSHKYFENEVQILFKNASAKNHWRVLFITPFF